MGLLKPEIVVQFPQSSESIVLPQDESHLDLAGRGRACPQNSAKGQQKRVGIPLSFAWTRTPSDLINGTSYRA